MNPNLVWLILLGVFPMTAVGLVTIGQPVRPVWHLLKASLFWTLVIWIVIAAWLWRVL